MPKPLLLAALLLTVTAAAPARAELPARLRAADAELLLNGAGARTKYFMQMYVAGLYLPAPSADPAAIIAADEPMAIRLEITSGMVTQQKLVDSLNEGFTNATAGKPAALRAEIEQFRALFAAEIAKGDVFDIVYLPKQGVIVLKNGKPQGAVAGLPFKQALFAIWLGDSPADDDLKLALLKK